MGFDDLSFFSALNVSAKAYRATINQSLLIEEATNQNKDDDDYNNDFFLFCFVQDSVDETTLSLKKREQSLDSLFQLLEFESGHFFFFYLFIVWLYN